MKMSSGNFKIYDRPGFTAIELILYIAISSVMLSVISIFLATVLESRVKNQTIAEVEQTAAQVLHLISQTTRNALSINSPAPGLSAPSLSLKVINPAKDPTVFDLSLGTVRITEGVSPPVVLTNSRMIASALNFDNLSRSSTPGTIRFQFTLTHQNPEGRNEQDFSKNFYGSASLR